MKLKTLVAFLLPLAITAIFLSCEEEKEEYVHPVFGKMIQEPSKVSPGEMVTLTVSQQQKGNGIEKTTYTWTIKSFHIVPGEGTIKDSVFTERTNYDGYGKADPVLTFRVPSTCTLGSYKVQLHAQFTGYIGNNLWDEASTWGTLIVQ